MRKIPSNLDNPIDNILISLSENSMQTLKDLNMTPNILTSISLLLAILSAILFLHDYYKISAIVFLISYIFDCYDGHFARKYNMVTQFGCYYDHISDSFKYLLFAIIIYYKSPTKFFVLLPIFLLLFTLSLMHAGCIELVTDQDIQSQSLSYFKSMCPTIKDPSISLNYTRYFGFGTFNILFVIVIFTFGSF